MYSQANVRAGKWLRPPPRALPSVIVDTEKVLREADGPVEMSALTLPSGGKVFAPGCASKNRTVTAGEEPEEHKRLLHKQKDGGIEIRIWSVGQDNSQSWVRISYGTVKYVIDSNQNNTEIPADPQEDQLPQTSIKVVAARSKAKAKPQQREPVDTPTIIPMHERRWIDIEPSEQTLAAYDLSKKVISLLRHNQTVQREEDGGIQFWRIKFHLRNHSSQVQHWSDDRWKSGLAAGGGTKRRYQYCSDNSGTVLYLRALQGHSGHNLIDPTLQDNVIIQRGLFHHIYHIGCAFNLHSIINNGLIPGRSGFEQKTDSILLAH